MEKLPVESLETAETQARTVNIGGRFFTPAEAAEIDEQIDYLEALLRDKRAREARGACPACGQVRS